MKKKILALTMSLIIALGISACGNEPAADGGSVSTREESGAEESSSEESSALTEWYNGADRTALEKSINDIFESSGLTFFVTIEEPDTIIYNYKYIEQLDLSGSSQEEIDASFTSSLDAGVSSIISDISTYRTTYGIPLTTIRMVYLNADGSLIYSKDITEDYVPSAASGDEGSVVASSNGAYESLQAWMESDEAALTIETTNKAIASTGMTMGLSADGNVFVYEYYVPDELGFNDLTEEQLAATFDPVVEGQRSSIDSLFDNFETAYNLTVDAVRFTFYNADGAELYSTEVANE